MFGSSSEQIEKKKSVCPAQTKLLHQNKETDSTIKLASLSVQLNTYSTE